MSKEQASTKKESTNSDSFLFGKENYLLMGAAVLFIIIGFGFMAGKSEDIFSFQKITLAPIMVIAGFVVGIFAIMRKKA
jgi:hypothetical protein